jgi:hypothetical protein
MCWCHTHGTSSKTEIAITAMAWLFTNLHARSNPSSFVFVVEEIKYVSAGVSRVKFYYPFRR